jgi:hypothetical protein
MENTILEKAVEPKNTVQFLPKDLFKVISKKYHAFHGWYHACISGYPCGVKQYNNSPAAEELVDMLNELREMAENE